MGKLCAVLERELAGWRGNRLPTHPCSSLSCACSRRAGRWGRQHPGACRPWPLPARGTDGCDQGGAVGCRVTSWS